MFTLAQVPIGIFDALTVAVAVIGYAMGRKKGLVWQVSGVATLVLGGVCATILASPLGPIFAEGILGRFAAWVVVYALVAASLYVLSLKLKHRIEKLEFEELDQRFGGILGAFKGLFAFGVLALIASGISSGIATSIRESASGRALLVIVEELRPIVPERVSRALFPDAPDPTASDPDEPDAAIPALPPEGGVPPAPAFPPEPRPEPAGPSDPAPELSLPDPGVDPATGIGGADPRDPWDPSGDPLDPLAPPR